jgi:ribose 5-phosphate isomerase A
MNTEASIQQIKKMVGEAGAQLVKNDMVIGIGSGSTVGYFISALGQRTRDGLSFKAVPTSTQSKALALAEGIKLLELGDVSSIDLTIDGADELDTQLRLIKGGGGFLLQEKLVAAVSTQLVIIADYGKLKDQIGAFALPIEVVPYGWNHIQKRLLDRFGKKSMLRLKDGKPYVTDHGHYLLDCAFGLIADPDELNTELHLIPGVVETGLFLNMATKALVGYPDGKIVEMLPK